MEQQVTFIKPRSKIVYVCIQDTNYVLGHVTSNLIELTQYVMN